MQGRKHLLKYDELLRCGLTSLELEEVIRRGRGRIDDVARCRKTRGEKDGTRCFAE